MWSKFNGFVKYSIWSVKLPFPSLLYALTLVYYSAERSGSNCWQFIASDAEISPSLPTWLLCVPVPHVYVHERGTGDDSYLKFHRVSKGKPASGQSGWLPMAKGKELMLSLFKRKKKKSFLLNKQSSWHVSSRTNTYHSPIFIWHNGPICFLLTYTAVSVRSSNHWKLTGCRMCSFHYWGEDKDSGHLTSFPLMNLNERDMIFGEHKMYSKLLMVWESMLGKNIGNVGASLMTFERSGGS